MNRSVHQYNPDTPGALPYAPQRDIAHLFLPMLKEAFSGLDRKHWSPFFQKLFEDAGISEEMIGEAVILFTNAITHFIRTPNINSSADAFAFTGFLEQAEPVKQAIFCRLGQVLTGGFFISVRDVTFRGVASPTAPDMAAMLAHGRALAERINGPFPQYTVTDFDTMRAEATLQNQLIRQLQTEVKELSQEVITLRAQLKAATHEHTNGNPDTPQGVSAIPTTEQLPGN